MRVIIARSGNNETVSYAVSELCRLLKEMDRALVLDVRKYPEFDENLKNTIWVGPDFIDRDEKDRIFIDVKGSVGVISGSNERSVLMAVYRFMKELGCRYLYPGKEGEKVPKRCLDYADLTVKVNETPSYNHRGICIEGAVGYEHVLNTIDWLPKVGMNEYFSQFDAPTEFFKRYYNNFTNDKNDLHYGVEYSDEDAKATSELLLDEVKKRGLLYQTGGHVWIGKALGLSASGWESNAPEIDEETRSLLALVNGERKFKDGIVSRTNLCYSNPEARRRLVDVVVNHAKKNPDIDCLSFWLADEVNVYCECEKCRQKTPSDHYISIFNDIDEALTKEGLPTKIIGAFYLELLYPPKTERLKNPDRFVFDFAPISRSYSHSYDEYDFEKETEYAPYKLNKFEYEKDLLSNVAKLKDWQKQGVTNTYLFDYHMMWDHHNDFGYYSIAKILHRDMKVLDRLGLDGMMSCQCLRVAFPTGLPQYAMVEALWSKEKSFEEIEKEYFSAAYGENWETVRNYLAEISRLCDPEFLRGDREKAPEDIIADANGMRELAASFKVEVLPKIRTSDIEWDYLDLHADMCKYYSDIIEAIATGSEKICQEKYDIYDKFVLDNAEIADSVLDTCFVRGDVWHTFRRVLGIGWFF